ncbi:MAG: acyltransferase [Planctomycetota bacterium]
MPATASSTTPIGVTSPREHAGQSKPGLVALRGWAAVAVVLLHASVPYANPAMPGLAWPVRDIATDPGWTTSLVTHGMWAIEVFIMPVFLVLAGFLAHQSFAQRDASSVVRSRLWRLGLPFVLGMLLVGPADLYTWLLGWAVEERIPLIKMRSLKFEAGVDDGLWGTSHLWFLMYLASYFAVIGALGHRARNQIGKISKQHPCWCGSGLFLAACFILTLAPEVVWGFQHSFLPIPSKWAYSGAFFLAGLLLGQHDRTLDHMERLGPRTLSVGLVCLAAATALGMWCVAQPHDATFARITLGCLTPLAASTVTLGLLGTAQRLVTQPDRVTSHLAAASLWIYVLHHPIIGLSHITWKVTGFTTNPLWKVMASTVIGVLWACACRSLIRTCYERQRARSVEQEPQVLAFESGSNSEKRQSARRAA